MGLFDDLIPSGKSSLPPQAEGFGSNPRGFSIGDVQAAMRGDMFNSPGLPIKYEAQPGQQFGQEATANAQPFGNIVAHHTGGPTLGGALDTARRGGPFGIKTGYHFYIDTDGTVVQGAPLDARTNHVKPPGAAQRTDRADIGNSNSIGVSFVGTGSNPNPEQLAAAENLTRSLQGRYGIGPENVVGHGQIQNDRQTAEGMPLVNAIRNGPMVAQAQPVGPSGPGVANAGLPPPVPKAPEYQRLPDQKKAGMFDDLVPQKKPDMGRGAAFMEGARSGFTANFGDEMAGASAAAATPKELKNPFDYPAEAVRGLAQLGYEYMTGGDAAAKRYSERRDEVRAGQKAAEEQYPGTNIAGNVAGAVAVPLGPLMAGATLPARIGRGMAVGAGFGGLSGAGAGTDAASRVSGAAMGTAVGGVVGAAAPPVVEGAIQGVRAVSAPLVSAVRGLANPEKEAARRTVTAITRDMQAGTANMTPQEYGASRAAGAPMAVADMGGETTRALARSAANVSPEGRATLSNLAQSRFAGQTDRASDFLQRLTGGAVDTAEKRAELLTQARNVNRPAYNAAYSRPAAQGMWDEGFEQIAQAPVVQDAIRAASVTAANRGTADGLGRIQSPFVVDQATGALRLRVDAQGNRVLPNLQFWDHVKRNLDKINTPEARTLNGALKSHLDDLVPEYNTARAGAAKFFDAEDALSAGENFVRQNKNIGEAARALGKMSSEERELFKHGFVARLIDDVQSTRDNVNVLNKIGASAQARHKLQMVLGPQGYRNTEAFLVVEHAMDRLRPAVTGNSTTARQLMELGAAGGVGGLSVMNSDPLAAANGAAVWGLLRAQRGIDARVAKRVAEMLSSGDPQVLAQGVRAVASNKKMLDAFRSVERGSTRVSGNQASVPALQGPITRAEDQPEIPRPPGQ